MTDPIVAKTIFGMNMIGPADLFSIHDRLPAALPESAAAIPWDEEILRSKAENNLLIYGPSHDVSGTPITLLWLRERFGCNPDASEPCVYNQDWYLDEPFAKDITLENRWYLLDKQVSEKTRGIMPDTISSSFGNQERFPSAILTAFAFFTYYLLNDEAMLWQHDFVWCRDTDATGDQIYTGRYDDPNGKNKNGFNIHRHLRIRPWYGAITERV